MMLELILVLYALEPQKTQKERCAPNEIDASVRRTSSAMECVDRNGHCVSVTIGGNPTVPLTDETIAARVHAIKHGEDVCWQLTQPVSTQFRVTAGMGGLYPKFIGTLEQVQVNLYRLRQLGPAGSSAQVDPKLAPAPKRE